MSNIAIRAESLGKRYRIGSAPDAGYKTFREAIVRVAKGPLRNLNRLRRLGSFREEDLDDVIWALRDISFEIKHGEVFGVIGRNGAGKSTLLKVLSRITEPTVGHAEVHGRVGSLLEVGTGFHPELTGRENIYLNGSILGMDRAHIDGKFEEIVEFSGVSKFIDTPVKWYSSGMYLRLAFAVAAHLEPEILVVDEVLAVGDAQFQRKCLAKMSDVRGEGRTVIFVSHNLTAVRALCDRALLLREGTLIANTSASEAVAMYVAEIRDSILSREYPNQSSAPQNASAVISEVAVRASDGAPLEEIDTATPFTIDIDYTTKQDGAFVGINVLVYDLENNLIFQSLNTVEPTWYGRPMPLGAYRTSCHVPGNLLNAEWYVIGVQLFGLGFSDLHLTTEVLRLEVQDAPDARGDYFGQYPGFVRPLIKWRTRPLEHGLGIYG